MSIKNVLVSTQRNILKVLRPPVFGRGTALHGAEHHIKTTPGSPVYSNLRPSPPIGLNRWRRNSSWWLIKEWLDHREDGHHPCTLFPNKTEAYNSVPYPADIRRPILKISRSNYIFFFFFYLLVEITINSRVKNFQ